MAPSYRVEVYRLGAYAGGSCAARARTRARGRPGPAGGRCCSPVSTRTVVAPWAVDVRDRHSRLGARLPRREAGDPRGGRRRCRTSCRRPRPPARVALVAPVTTWQAYNQWGGYSLYHGPAGDSRSHVVSFDRPYSWSMGPANDFRTSTVPLVLRAERLGVPLSYFTNVDLHLRPGALEGARGYVSMGHDEYWTTTMRDVVTTARGGRHQPGDPGRQHDVLAGAARGRRRAAGAPAGRLPRLRGARPDAARRTPPRRRPASATRRTRGRSTRCWACSTSATPSTPTTSWRRRAGGASRAPASRPATRSPAWSGPRPTGSTPTGGCRGRCRS